MPRFFFTTEDGEITRDLEGEDLEDESAARRAAVMLMGAILSDTPEELLEDRRWRMVVATNAEGDLFSLEVRLLSGSSISNWSDPAWRRGPS